MDDESVSEAMSAGAKVSVGRRLTSLSTKGYESDGSRLLCALGKRGGVHDGH